MTSYWIACKHYFQIPHVFYAIALPLVSADIFSICNALIYATRQPICLPCHKQAFQNISGFPVIFSLIPHSGLAVWDVKINWLPQKTVPLHVAHKNLAGTSEGGISGLVKKAVKEASVHALMLLSELSFLSGLWLSAP